MSVALGAFFAGMVMQESRYAHRAATNSLPLQDAFVRDSFFVSVGLMLDWHIFIQRPGEVLMVVLIIMGVTDFPFAFGLSVLLRWPLDTALTVAACLGQIGEFSYILAQQGISLGLADSKMMSLIVAGSIVTIALNPLLFAVIPKLRHFLVVRFGWAKRAAMRAAPDENLGSTSHEFLDGQTIVVGTGFSTKELFDMLEEMERRTIVIASADAPIDELKARGFKVIAGDAADPMVLVQAHVATAAVLVLPLGDSILARKVIDLARELNNRIRVVVRVPTAEEAVLFEKDEGVTVVCDEVARSAAFTMATIASLAQNDAKKAEPGAARKEEGVRDADDDEDDDDEEDEDTSSESADGAATIEGAADGGSSERFNARRFRRFERFASAVRQAVRGRAGEPEVPEADPASPAASSGADDRPKISEHKEREIREGALLFLEGLERTTKKLADRYRARKAPKHTADEHSDEASGAATSSSGASETSGDRDDRPKA